MAYRFASVQTNVIVASPAAAAETIVATTGAINPPNDAAVFLLFWFCELTIGTSGTALNAKIRRGAALTSTLINVGQARTVAAGNLVSFSGYYFDTPGAVAEVQYSLTLQVTAGAAASTLTDVCLLALAL